MSPYTGKFLFPIGLGLLAVGILNHPSAAFAVDIPAAADVGRVKPNQDLPTPPTATFMPLVPELPESPVPEHADRIHLTLKAVEIQGVTAFDPAVFKMFYADMLGKDTTLDKVWLISAKITDYYHQHGFFLSRAFVPAQTIEQGTFIIQVVEGYIGAVDLPEDLQDIRLVRAAVEKITAERPLKASTVESVLLRLNNLPGIAVRSVLQPLQDTEGAAKLALISDKKSYDASVQLDNYGTRYSGPWQATAVFQGSLIPLQDTNIVGFSSVPSSELKYASIQQRIPLSLAVDLTLQASHNVSAPGYTLRDLDIRGDSDSVGVGLNYSVIRQRDENLLLSALLEGRNSNTDILINTKLTRDRIRVLRVGGHYDHVDRWSGVNSYDVKITKGLSSFGANGAHDLNLSRGGARPDFMKEEFTFNRWQNIGSDFNLLFSAMAQHTTDPLYASEEIGYGGQVYGRAYDSSELTGTRGIMAMAELRYGGIAPLGKMHTEPYIFYDVARLWGEAAGQPAVSAASAGLGLRLNSEWNVSADFTAAKPLTRAAATPINGGGSSPRFLAKVRIGF